MQSHMVKTLAELKKYNIDYWIVERYNSFTKKRTDLFNIFDVLTMDNGIVGIQVCGMDVNSHKEKIMVEHAGYTKKWLENGGRIEIWAWRKLKKIKKDGKKGKQNVWKVRLFNVFLVDYELYWEEAKARFKKVRENRQEAL